MSAEETTHCWNCFGPQEPKTMCGFPEVGCELCEKYGDGRGNLNTNLVKTSVTVNGKIYTNPHCKCVLCRDTKQRIYPIWVRSRENPGCSDGGLHSMPRATLPCHKCCEIEFYVALENEKKKHQ
jgi:hypothetical protein